ncbi:helix-turn-helix domain-containing protein [Lentibacter sp. XHP0401]|jgi:XRE family transcriptional regulator, fatty acid utilization regulator|uniref:helix-turn-helix domain-containing protein n=1 Tax=Lentibacter sp. XHP0401 TaxID=2984334 RepID=UPI0021E72990|nr:helix-turn-helix domain-containing protein [Lentibacter sp. XHP0401]MCV2893889.1 short-chain fatty acyl-CoA regulator family protein [Lentibacter sp. XHP0401]
MATRTLAGSRIRERRIAQGLKQADLAADVGISPSYLNLIEHNRRRIGGKLLRAMALRLEVEPALLAEGAEQEVIARLGNVAARLGEEIGVAESTAFAGRFPGWANLMIRAARRIDELERNVETLTDRLTHDPHLAATLHEVLSTVTSIRSTASILQDTREIEPEWRDRFHRNINEDSARLAERAQALVGFLDGAGDAQSEVSSPQEEVAGFLSAFDWHFPALEEARVDAAEGYLRGAAQLKSSSAQAIAGRYLACYAKDAEDMPLEAFRGAIGEHGPEPLRLAAEFDQDLASVMRRLATLPEHGFGLVVCDASGTMLYRKPADGFPIPRFGAMCPLWPLFQALSRPMMPLAQRVAQPGRGGTSENVFETYAIAQAVLSTDYGYEPLLEATMLIAPMTAETGTQGARLIGASCRICPREGCAARREPSIVSSRL